MPRTQGSRYREHPFAHGATLSTCSKTTWRFCDRSARESPFKTGDYSLTSAKCKNPAHINQIAPPHMSLRAERSKPRRRHPDHQPQRDLRSHSSGLSRPIRHPERLFPNLPRCLSRVYRGKNKAQSTDLGSPRRPSSEPPFPAPVIPSAAQQGRGSDQHSTQEIPPLWSG